MPYKQVKSFNQNKAGKEAGMCLKNTRLGYGIAPKYNNAWEAWLNTERHAMRDYPAGVDVPIYFWYKDAKHGHIGVRLANGKFWTDGRVFDSVEAYEAAKDPNFVGWGESINGVRVIEYVPDPPKPTSTSKMPAVDSKIQLIPTQTRTTFKRNTDTKAGEIHVKDNTYVYTVRFVRGYRIGINSASGGGNDVELALYYKDGKLIDGWRAV